MTDPNKNISSSSKDVPCEKKLDSSAVTKENKKETCKKKTEKEEDAKPEKTGSVCKSPADNEQARLNKSPCPEEYAAPRCDKEVSIPPNPRKKMQKNETKTDDETKDDDKDPCASPCFKTLDDAPKKGEDGQKPC